MVCVETELDLRALFRLLQDIEAGFGRVRTVRNAPRVLDLDILAYHDTVYEADDLVVPHPRMHERGFVLYPLQEIAPDWIHPVLKMPVAAFISSLPDSQMTEPIEPEAA